MSAWYMDMWVNAPWPTASPTAHTSSTPTTRMWSSTGSEWADPSSPREATFSWARSGRRPAATSSRSATTGSPAPRDTAKRWPSWWTESMVTPVRTSMPSSPNTSASNAPASGSSGPIRWGATSSTVTSAPKRRNTWASSTPMAPPPRTTSEAGTSSVSMASRLVQYGVPASPATGGIQARVPMLRTTPRSASMIVSPTATRFGPSSRPQPRTRRPPLPSNRSAATVSSHESVASARMRRATGAQSACTVEEPAMPGTRRASASRSEARIIILEGTHPQ